MRVAPLHQRTNFGVGDHKNILKDQVLPPLPDILQFEDFSIEYDSLKLKTDLIYEGAQFQCTFCHCPSVHFFICLICHLIVSRLLSWVIIIISSSVDHQRGKVEKRNRGKEEKRKKRKREKENMRKREKEVKVKRGKRKKEKGKR